MANSVAQDIQALVGSIFAKYNLFAARVIEKLAFRALQQRSDQNQFRIGRRGTRPIHSGQSLPPAPAEQPKEEQLDLIIGMMG